MSASSAASAPKAELCDTAAAAVYEGIVHDGEQPAAQVAVRPKRALPFISARERVLNKALGLSLVPCQGAGVAPQGTEQPNHIHAL